MTPQPISTAGIHSPGECDLIPVPRAVLEWLTTAAEQGAAFAEVRSAAKVARTLLERRTK